MEKGTKKPAQCRHVVYLKWLGFKKKWLPDHSGWWLEKKVKNKALGEVKIWVDEDLLIVNICFRTKNTGDSREVYCKRFTKKRLKKIMKIFSK